MVRTQSEKWMSGGYYRVSRGFVGVRGLQAPALEANGPTSPAHCRDKSPLLTGGTAGHLLKSQMRFESATQPFNLGMISE